MLNLLCDNNFIACDFRHFKGTVQRDGSGWNKVHSIGRQLRVMAQRFFRKIGPSPILWEPFKDSATPRTATVLEIRILIANSAHSSVSDLLLLHTAVGNGAMNKFENCVSLAHWTFSLYTTAQWMLCDIGNCAMNPLQYWQLRDDACECILTARWISWLRWQLGF